jgi:3-deoxy-7-phosphoheptulonate synthase
MSILTLIPGKPRYERLIRPAALAAQLPLGRHAATVASHRQAVRDVLAGRDDRLLVITGPCSVHDPGAALEYAAWLADQQASLGDELMLIMRAHVDKPRTIGGWKGMISDPFLTGPGDIPQGIRAARSLLVAVVARGVAAATEWLDPLTVPYLADTITWGTIGARTVESQPHRHLAAALPMPVGFKNGADGDVAPAVNACLAAAAPQCFLGSSPWDGAPAAVRAPGNPDTCVVLRGGKGGPNYQPADVARALRLMTAAGLPRRVVIDASHGNSGKDHRRQPAVATSVAAQVAGVADGPAGGAGERAIVGVMLESFLVAGRQDLPPGGGASGLTYGQSVTDACIGLPATQALLAELAAAVRARRGAR